MKKVLLGFALVALHLLGSGTAHAWHAEGLIRCRQEAIAGAVVTVECDDSIYSVVESTANGYYAIEFPHEAVVCTLSVDVSGKIDEPISVLSPGDALVDNGVGSVVRISGTHFINWIFGSPSCSTTSTTSTIPTTTTTTINLCGNNVLDPGEDCDPPGFCCGENCSYVPEGTPCPDDSLCNGEETCDGMGTCEPGTPPDCDDGVNCTDDSCDPVAGCQNEDICPTGEFCNREADQCQIPSCSITLSNSILIVAVLGTLNFDVVVDGTCGAVPSYTWAISDTGCTGDATGSAIGSTVDANGLYTAGFIQGTDIVRVIDENNGDICAIGEVTVVSTTTTTVIPTTTTTIGSPIASYCKDFLEQGNPGGWTGSLKTFDDEWALSPGSTVDMDIWLNDLPEPLLTAGVFITFDPALITITNLIPNDTSSGGQWDGGFTSGFQVDPGIWFLALANFGCVEPDIDGDILLARAAFQRQAVGVVEVTISTIPGFDTVVDCSARPYDPQIPPNTIIINDAFTASGCSGNFDNDSDVDGTDARIFKEDFGRSTYSNPCEGGNLCNGDFDCDADVDGMDAYGFKAEFGRCEFDNPCPSNAATEECTY